MVERCDNVEDRDKHLETLKTKLEERNYPPDLIKKQFKGPKRRKERRLFFKRGRRNYRRMDKLD